MFIVFFLVALVGFVDAGSINPANLLQQGYVVNLYIGAGLALLAGVLDCWGWVLRSHARAIRKALDKLPDEIADAIAEERRRD